MTHRIFNTFEFMKNVNYLNLNDQLHDLRERIINKRKSFLIFNIFQNANQINTL